MIKTADHQPSGSLQGSGGADRDSKHQQSVIISDVLSHVSCGGVLWRKIEKRREWGGPWGNYFK